MKNILFLFLFVFSASMATAQTCTKAKSAEGKSCAKTCASKKSASLTKVASAVMTADLAAEADETIEKRVCSKSGATSFYKKSTCSETGKISHAEVEFDKEAQTFVSVKSSLMESEASPKATPAPAKKACCANGKSCEKACCADKASRDGKVMSAVKTATTKSCAKTCTAKKAAVNQ